MTAMDTYSRIRPHCTTVPSLDANRHALQVVALIVAGRRAARPYGNEEHDRRSQHTLDGLTAATGGQEGL